MSSGLQSMMNAILETRGVQWLTGSHTANVAKYVNFLISACLGESGKKIKVASDCLHPLFFNNDKIVEALRLNLNQGVKLQAIFHRGDNAREAITSLKRTNPRLYNLWRQEQENFTIFWSPVVLNQPFVVISGVGVLFEIRERWQAFSIKNKKLAVEWEGRFNKHIGAGCLKPISFSCN